MSDYSEIADAVLDELRLHLRIVFHEIKRRNLITDPLDPINSALIRASFLLFGDVCGGPDPTPPHVFVKVHPEPPTSRLRLVGHDT